MMHFLLRTFPSGAFILLEAPEMLFFTVEDQSGQKSQNLGLALDLLRTGGP